MDRVTTAPRDCLTYEEALERVGGFGRYQWLVLIHNTLSVAMESCFLGYMSFAGAIPKLSCSEDGTNCTETVQFYSIANEFDLEGPRFHLTAQASSVMLLGMFSGPVLAGQLADLCGRKFAYILCYTLLAIFGILSSLSPSVEMFTCLRFFCGLATTAATCIAYVWYVEFMPVKYRLANQILGYALGNVVLAVVAYLAFDWRVLGYCICGPGLLVIPAAFALRESPKWYLQRGKIERTIDILRTVAKWNGKKLEKSLAWTINSGVTATSASYLDLFRTRRTAVLTASLSCSYAVGAVTFFALTYGISAFGGNIFVNVVLLNLFRLCFNCMTFALDMKARWFGRKMCAAAGFIGIGASLFGMAVCYSIPQTASIKVVTAGLAIFGVSFGAGRVFLATDLLTAEAYPTGLRSRGYGFVLCMSRLGGALGPQVLLLSQTWQPAPFLILSSTAVVGLMVCLCCIEETKGKPLPDTLHPNNNQTESTDNRVGISTTEASGESKQCATVSETFERIQDDNFSAASTTLGGAVANPGFSAEV